MAKGIVRWFAHIVFQAKIQTYYARRGIAAANNPLNPDNKAGMSDSVPTAKLNDLGDRLNRCGFVVADAEHSSDVRKNYLDLALQLDTIAAQRIRSFLIRHNLVDQFFKQDEAGQR